MGKKIIFVFSLLVLLQGAAAQVDVLVADGTTIHAGSVDVGSYLNASFLENGTLDPSLEGNLDQATSEFAQLPGPVQALFGNQTIALDLKREDGTIEHLGITIQDNTVKSFTRFSPQNPTMRVETDEETVLNIAESKDKTGAFLEAVNSKTLTYEGLNSSGETAAFATGIFTWITLVIKSFAHFFGLG